MRVFPYTRTVLSAWRWPPSASAWGLSCVVWYLTHGMHLPAASSLLDHLAVTGFLLIYCGFSTFCFTLLLYATGVRYRPPEHCATRTHALTRSS